MKYFLLIITSLLFVTSCKQDSVSSGLANAEKLVSEDPSKENVQRLVEAIIAEYKSAETKEDKLVLLNKGLSVANEYDLKTEKRSFRLGIITEDPASDQTGNLLLNIADEVKQSGKDDVYAIMIKGIHDNYPSLKDKVSKKLMNNDFDVDTLIFNIGKSIFPADDPTSVNVEAAHNYVDLCEAYALVNPGSEKSLDYLFKAAEMARSIKSFNKAMSLYDIILARYPDSKKAASALFVKAFIMENTYKRPEEAKTMYIEFLEKYPNDDLADDVQVLIDNLGKSDEELFQAIQKTDQ